MPVYRTGGLRLSHQRRDSTVPTLSDQLSEMPLRERAAGSRLQVSLERDRSRLVGELHDDVDTPGSSIRGVPAAAVIMIEQSRRKVRRHSRVVPRRRGVVSEDVDNPSR
jgi:hypothetical protein